MQKDYNCAIVILKSLAFYSSASINFSMNYTLYKTCKIQKRKHELCEELRISTNVAYASLCLQFRYLLQYKGEGHQDSIKYRCD